MCTFSHETVWDERMTTIFRDVMQSQAADTPKIAIPIAFPALILWLLAPECDPIRLKHIRFF
jgi:hypothetical protein